MDKIYEILENKETDYTPQFVLPKDIEARSMEIIESEMITEVPEEYKPIVKGLYILQPILTMKQVCIFHQIV